jgi:2-dehydropantoate 2-reductase
LKVVVVGAGAIGSVVAAILHRGGLDVRLLGRRTEAIATIAREGLCIEGVRGSYIAPVPISVEWRGGDVDLAVLCVKAYDTAGAVDAHFPLFRQARLVLSLQNGIGNVESLAERLGTDRLLAGTTTMGANVRSPGHVVHAGEGDTVVGEVSGELSARVTEVAAALSRAGLRTLAVADIHQTLWMKLGVNAAINPVTALLEVVNGELAARPALRPLIEAIVAEVVAVARQVGVSLHAAELSARVWQVVAMTKDNRTSMLADLAAGRRTEIDAINGAVVRLGREHRVPTPVNETLTRLIEARAGT